MLFILLLLRQHVLFLLHIVLDYLHCSLAFLLLRLSLPLLLVFQLQGKLVDSFALFVIALFGIPLLFCLDLSEHLITLLLCLIGLLLLFDLLLTFDL